ncbi:MAG TPA: hypothetical protein VFM75_08505, partial [Modicisalibacter sp.]|nr:hypothetical protein [Modicisalibacter sp.]
ISTYWQSTPSAIRPTWVARAFVRWRQVDLAASQVRHVLGFCSVTNFVSLYEIDSINQLKDASS